MGLFPSTAVPSRHPQLLLAPFYGRHSPTPPVIDEARVETHIADDNFVCLLLISKTKTNKHHEVDDLEIRKDFEHHSHFSGLL